MIHMFDSRIFEYDSGIGHVNDHGSIIVTNPLNTMPQ